MIRCDTCIGLVPVLVCNYFLYFMLFGYAANDCCSVLTIVYNGFVFEYQIGEGQPTLVLYFYRHVNLDYALVVRCRRNIESLISVTSQGDKFIILRNSKKTLARIPRRFQERILLHNSQGFYHLYLF